MTPALHVLRAGMATTVQDLGRPGYQRFGVPTCGALDAECHVLANALVGNPAAAATLEIRLFGPRLEVRAESARLALVGGGGVLVVAGAEPRSVPEGRSVAVVRGEVVEVGALRDGATAYLAVAGGVAVPPVLGSRATFLRGPFGGLDGRALADGDHLPLALDDAGPGPDRALAAPVPGRPQVLHVVLGPQQDLFTDKAIADFLESDYEVTREADRMGIRFAGPELAHRGGFDIVSDGIAAGAVQVPGSRQPILLLADRQTTGGYPKIATVVTADLPGCGRLRPGDRVRFRAVDVAAAEAMARARARALRDLLAAVGPADGSRVDEDALYAENLISGVTSARAR